jgi:hypothetical protein
MPPPSDGVDVLHGGSRAASVRRGAAQTKGGGNAEKGNYRGQATRTGARVGFLPPLAARAGARAV